ncbi:arsenate reductase ArsC [Dictyobacter kobayashii]|uniref:Phosphotyrosine protein phosphatase I domain-containing protein n=1 Tax=Dictyobacter kobayashii TaxID=2014872 RepID=A0A402AYE4_9CHLR|nr:arsenate reductase ArsC [Dictyobacter kobayashii]GCE24129.1 hypothetical protein KDK_79290 [Dictyobacter kobayashii]
MAEAFLRQLSQGQIEVFSAGSHPTQLHPLAQKAMAQAGFDMEGQRSKSIDELKEQHFDYVITVCDRMREVCPTLPDQPELMHWSLPDPALVEGSHEERYQAFERIARQLVVRVRYLLVLLAQERLVEK